MGTDATSVSAAVDQRLADVLQGCVALLAGICIAFSFDWKMASAGVIVPSIVVIVQITLTNALKRQIRRDAVSSEETARVSFESSSTK